jgi:hypothetical protein
VDCLVWFVPSGGGGRLLAVVAPGSVVVIREFDDVPEHLFLVDSVEEDLVTGYAVSGWLAGAYGEPSIQLIKELK